LPDPKGNANQKGWLAQNIFIKRKAASNLKRLSSFNIW